MDLLDFTLYEKLLKSINKNDPFTLEKLLRVAGIKATAYNNTLHGSLLHLSVEQGSLEMTSYLIKAGCDVNARGDMNDWTPLTCASGIGNSEKQANITRLLIQAGADTNILVEGRPVMSFFEGKRREMLDVLLAERGASP